MHATIKSALVVALVFQLLLSAVTTTAVLGSPDDSHRCVPQDPERPSLAGQTLEIASEKLRDRQLLPLTCIYRNLALRFKNADLVFIAFQDILEPGDEGDGEKPTRVTVERVLKSTEKATVKAGDALHLPAKYVPHDSLVVLVFCQQDGGRGMVITEGEWLSREMADHLTILSTFTDPRARFEYLLDQEQHANSSIAQNVFYELMSTSEATLNQIASSIPKQHVISGVPIFGTSIGSRRLTERDLFYIKLLGIVGDAEDVHHLEPLVFGAQPGPPKLRVMHSEAVRSYLKLAGAAAGQKLIDAVSAQLLQDAAKESQVKPNWAKVYRLLTAAQSLRHEKEFEPFYQAVCKLLMYQTPFADIVLHTAASDRDPRWVDDAIRLYRDNKEDYVRNRILVYLHVIRRDRPNALSPAQQDSLESFLVKVERDAPDANKRAKKILSFR